jgi:hypothetical protein
VPCPKPTFTAATRSREVYPPDALAGDAAQNARAPSTELSGVRVLSAPDAAGDFAFERATQQVGEATSAGFLAPYRRLDPRAGCEAFLADIVAAAQRFDFELKESPGRDEPRLRRLQQ